MRQFGGHSCLDSVRRCRNLCTVFFVGDFDDCGDLLLMMASSVSNHSHLCSRAPSPTREQSPSQPVYQNVEFGNEVTTTPSVSQHHFPLHPYIDDILPSKPPHQYLSPQPSPRKQRHHRRHITLATSSLLTQRAVTLSKLLYDVQQASRSLTASPIPKQTQQDHKTRNNFQNLEYESLPSVAPSTRSNDQSQHLERHQVRPVHQRSLDDQYNATHESYSNPLPLVVKHFAAHRSHNCDTQQNLQCNDNSHCGYSTCSQCEQRRSTHNCRDFHYLLSSEPNHNLGSTTFSSGSLKESHDDCSEQSFGNCQLFSESHLDKELSFDKSNDTVPIRLCGHPEMSDSISRSVVDENDSVLRQSNCIQKFNIQCGMSGAATRHTSLEDYNSSHELEVNSSTHCRGNLPNYELSPCPAKNVQQNANHASIDDDDTSSSQSTSSSTRRRDDSRRGDATSDT